MFVFGKKWLYSAKLLSSGKNFVFGQSGCIRAKVVVFGQKWLYSGKGCCVRAKVVDFGQSAFIRAKVVVLGQNDWIRAKWFYLEKVVVFGQWGFIWSKVVVFVQIVCILHKWLYLGKVVVFGQGGSVRAKWLYSDKVVVFGQSGCNRAKLVVFGQMLYLCKVVVFVQKWLYSVKLVLMADLNIDLLNFDTCQLTQVYVNMLSSYFILSQFIQPTRITHHTATIIDNIFISCTDQSKISGKVVHDITDHLPNFFILNKLSTFTSKQEIYKRDYSRLNESDLLQDLQSINWHDIFQPEDNLNLLFSSFHSHISNIIDKHAPIRKLTKNEMKYRSKPWITPGLKKSIKT